MKEVKVTGMCGIEIMNVFGYYFDKVNHKNIQLGYIIIGRLDKMYRLYTKSPPHKLNPNPCWRHVGFMTPYADMLKVVKKYFVCLSSYSHKVKNDRAGEKCPLVPYGFRR